MKTLYPTPKPFIIPIFLPHTGCPHRCVFCDQTAITGQKATASNPERVRQEIRAFLDYKKGAPATTQISFYGGNFLGQTEKQVRSLLEVANEFIDEKLVDSIRFSTRPDTIAAERMTWLTGYRVGTIELGAQSMEDEVLKASQRGHNTRDTERAVALVKESGYETGLQMMIGLPGDSPARALETGRRILALAPDFVRIYPTLVLAGSPLADQYRAGRYKPLALDEAVETASGLYRLFANGGIRVIRMGLQASEELDRDSTVLAGPYHAAFGQLVLSKLFFNGSCRALDGPEPTPDTISIAVHPRSVSNLRGHKNLNLEELQHRFPDHRIEVRTDPGLDEMEFAVNGRKPVSILAETKRQS
jgi:histone acetyltransferase (RNA polymerase elongator complex component)